MADEICIFKQSLCEFSSDVDKTFENINFEITNIKKL